MSRSIRFFEIIQILRQAQTPVTANELADVLEVTTRTIYRDIASLQASQLPIEGEAGIGYVMRSGFDLPPLMFSQNELEAISVGLALLGRTGDQGLEKAAQNVASKIASVLPQNTAYHAPHHVSKWNRIPQANITTQEIRQFIHEETELKIKYLDLNDKLTTRSVQPIALIYYIDVIILVAWCNLRQAFRHFRIDRIETYQATGKNFNEKGKSLREAWQRERSFS